MVWKFWGFGIESVRFFLIVVGWEWLFKILVLDVCFWLWEFKVNVVFFVELCSLGLILWFNDGCGDG